MIEVYQRFAYELEPCDHDGASVLYPDGSLHCYVCWAKAHQGPKTQLRHRPVRTERIYRGTPEERVAALERLDRASALRTA